MEFNTYLIVSGKIQPGTILVGQMKEFLKDSNEKWIDIPDVDPENLSKILAPLNLHPLQLARCLDTVNDPGVISFGKSFLMEYPAAFDPDVIIPAYLTILLQGRVLVTIRHGPMPSLDALIRELTGEAAPSVLHLPQLIYMILDEFADENAEAQVMIRDQITGLSNKLAENPDAVHTKDLASLRGQVEKLVSLVENQLYCISGLSACDNDALQDPHRKAFIDDLQSETEIMQRGVYRLENRVKDLYNDYQAAGSERVEKRLRLLTIVSAITLPLGLIAGLLGMNVGGVPGTTEPAGFLIVSGVMVAIVVVEYWYFRRKGWFD